MIFAPNRLLMVCVVATTLPKLSAAVMCVVCALSSCVTPAPKACARAGTMVRRRSKNGPAAIVGTDRLTLDGLVTGEIVAADEAAGLFHVVGEDVAERPF